MRRRAHDVFAAFDNWQDTASIKKEVETAFARGAGVTVERLRRALSRIVADGIYGPVSDADWRDATGHRMPFVDAKRIVRAAQDADLPSVELSHPDHGYTCEGAEDCTHPDHVELDDEGPMFHEEPVQIDRGDLIEWYFGALIPIYGSAYL